MDEEEEEIEKIDEEEYLIEESPDQELREKKEKIIDSIRRKRKIRL